MKSESEIARLLAEHMAEHDAQRVVAAELASVQEAATALHITVQGIHKMMNEGRLPIRKHLAEKSRGVGVAGK